MKGHPLECNPDNDHDLIRHSMQGDLSAFRKLVERHQSYVYSLGFRSLFNRQDAEDIVQETFIKVWLNLRYFDFRGKFTTWVYRIVVNLCCDRFKSKNRFTDYVASAPENSQGWMDLQGEMKKLEEKDMVEHIKMLADHLSPKQRMVFILRDLQDLSIEEVSEVMRMSEGSVKTNLYHARNAIRLNLKETGEG